MTTVHTLILVCHVLVGALMIGLILVQRGKGAEAGAAFGAGASATVFGAKGSANFLSRSTAVLATLFFVTSLSLAYIGSEPPVVNSVVEQGGSATTEPALAPADQGPAQPAGLREIPAPAAGTGATTPAGEKK
jgi:preprotein translocase subunit SecG